MRPPPIPCGWCSKMPGAIRPSQGRSRSSPSAASNTCGSTMGRTVIRTLTIRRSPRCCQGRPRRSPSRKLRLRCCGAGWLVSKTRTGAFHMTQAEISGISPFFIVSHVPSALSFYRDRLVFEITFQGPAPDDILFGIVRRGGAQILLKNVGVPPVPNYTRDVKKGIARWDAFVHVPDPDALAAEFASRNVEFFEPLRDTEDGLRGFEIKDADGYLLFFGRSRW